LKINLNYSYNNPKVKDFKEKPELNNKILTYAPKNQIKGFGKLEGRDNTLFLLKLCAG
jgi:hypothetical protein